MRESGTVQAVQYIVDRARWFLPGVGNGLDSLVYADRVQMELVDKKVVWVFGLDVPVGQNFGGKVAQVERDDDLGRARIAAARTCRSSRSGRWREPMSGS